MSSLASSGNHPTAAECERERILKLIGMIDEVHSDFTNAKGDIEYIQDDDAREELQAALHRAEQAITNFSNCFAVHMDDQIRDILDNYLPSSSDDDDNDEEEDEDIFDYEVEESTSRTSNTNTDEGQGWGTWKTIHEYPDLSEGKSGEVDEPTTFDRHSTPGLAGLAEWLGLGDIITVACVLNSKPVQYAFSKYRAKNGEISCARAPETLKLTAAFFIFSRERLLNYHGSKLCASKRPTDGINYAAALFANHVVKYLEGSCGEVSWTPVNHADSIEAYGIAKRRFAIALQIFWFLEKTFDLDL